MKDFTARIVAPLESVRPRGGRLIEGFSPKLQRRVRLVSHASFARWMSLEVDLAVSTFCEGSTGLAPEPPRAARRHLAAGRAEGEEMLLLEPDEAGTLPSQIDGIALRAVPAAELAAAGSGKNLVAAADCETIFASELQEAASWNGRSGLKREPARLSQPRFFPLPILDGNPHPGTQQSNRRSVHH